MPDILHKYVSTIWQHVPNFCSNQRISCGLLWNDSAKQLSVTIKVILALFFGRLRDGVRNRYIYSVQTSLKSVWNKSWLIRKNRVVKVEDSNEAVNFCWINITFILTYCVLARFPFTRVLISKWILVVVCQRFASFLFFHGSVGVSKIVDIGNSKMWNFPPSHLVLAFGLIFVTENLFPHLLSANISHSWAKFS